MRKWTVAEESMVSGWNPAWWFRILEAPKMVSHNFWGFNFFLWILHYQQHLFGVRSQLGCAIEFSYIEPTGWLPGRFPMMQFAGNCLQRYLFICHAMDLQNLWITCEYLSATVKPKAEVEAGWGFKMKFPSGHRLRPPVIVKSTVFSSWRP